MDAYTFRALAEDELLAWLAHCASIFGVDAAYFRAHWENDPDRALPGIFVAVLAGTYGRSVAIASTLRVFHRAVRIRGRTYRLGGIGEVCTQHAHQHRGLGTRLLQMALAYMRVEGLEVSALSTSVPTVPFYAKCGWRPVSLVFSNFALAAITQIPTEHAYVVEVVRAAQLCAKDQAQIKSLYNTYHAHFSGLLDRSDAYWSQWVFGREMSELMVIRREGEIVAYAAFKDKAPTLVLHEFACNEVLFASNRGTLAFRAAVEHFLLDYHGTSKMLKVPAALGVDLGQAASSEVHEAFMYQPLMVTEEAADRLADFMGSPHDHVLFDTDGY